MSYYVYPNHPITLHWQSLTQQEILEVKEMLREWRESKKPKGEVPLCDELGNPI